MNLYVLQLILIALIKFICTLRPDVDNSTITSIEWNAVIDKLLTDAERRCLYVITTENIAKSFYTFSDSVFVVTLARFQAKPDLGNTYKCIETAYVLLLDGDNDDGDDCWPATWSAFRPHRTIILIHNCSRSTPNNLQEAIYQDLYIFTLDIVNSSIILTSMRTGEIFTSTNLTSPLSDAQLHFKQPLRVLTFELSPYVHINHQQQISGLEIDILRLVTQGWPINITISAPFTWEDMMARLAAHDADIAIAAFWQSRVFKYRVDFVFPYMYVQSTFLVPDATLLPPETFVFQSLNERTWAMIVFTIAVTALTLRCVSGERPLDNYVMVTVAFFAINSTTTPSATKSRELLRFVLVLWSLTSLLLNTSYSAGFSAIASVPRMTKPIDTFQEAVGGRLHCHSLGGFTQGLLRDSGEYHKVLFADNMVIHEDAVPPVGVCTGVDLLRNSYVFAGYNLTRMDLLSLKLLREYIQSTYNVFVIARKVPFSRQINVRMVRLIEHGFIQYLLANNSDMSLYALKDFSFNSFTDGSYQSDATAFEQIQGAFYLLVIGEALALIAFGSELLRYGYKLRLKSY